MSTLVYFTESFGGLQAGGGRGVGQSRVSQQDLDQVGKLSYQRDFNFLIFICNDYIFLLQLKGDMDAGFGEALQRKLLEVEGLYSQVRSRYTFIQALVRRIRGLIRQPKS